VAQSEEDVDLLIVNTVLRIAQVKPHEVCIVGEDVDLLVLLHHSFFPEYEATHVKLTKAAKKSRKGYTETIWCIVPKIFAKY